MYAPRVPEPDPHAETICHRCSRVLRSGEGAFYVVRIEAFADPAPPEITLDDLAQGPAEAAAAYEEALAGLSGFSAQEMLDQVYRRLTIFLCASCYADWIENPTG